MRLYIMKLVVAVAAMLIVWHAGSCFAAIQFAQGHFYTTDFSNKKTIAQYDLNGSQLGTVNLSSAHELRGLAFGPDQLLYVVDSEPDRFNVFAINAGGAIQQTYSLPDPGGIRSLVSAGHIAFDGTGHFYVDHYKFTIGSPNSGQDFFTGTTMIDVAVGPNGNLLGVNDHDLFEVTPAGSFVRSIGPAPGYFFNHFLRAVTYDAQTDSIFVAMLGDSNSPHPLMKLNGTTGALLGSTSAPNSTDLFTTMSLGVVAGSRSNQPSRFEANLNLVGFLQGSGTERMFVTQLVPEPSVWQASLCVLLAMLQVRVRRN